jgi:hypothetical protein
LSGGLPADDWKNFKQRFPNPDLKPDQSENDTTFIARMEALDDAIEIRMWASYRGQTLARTVRGMMYYERSVPLSFEEVISREGVIGQCVRWYVVKFWSWVYHSTCPAAWSSPPPLLFFQNMWLLIFLHFITWYPLGDRTKRSMEWRITSVHQCFPFLIWFFFLSHCVLFPWQGAWISGFSGYSIGVWSVGIQRIGGTVIQS